MVDQAFAESSEAEESRRASCSEDVAEDRSDGGSEGRFISGYGYPDEDQEERSRSPRRFQRSSPSQSIYKVQAARHRHDRRRLSERTHEPHQAPRQPRPHDGRHQQLGAEPRCRTSRAQLFQQPR